MGGSYEKESEDQCCKASYGYGAGVEIFVVIFIFSVRETKPKEISPELANAKVGDVVTFGSCEQDNDRFNGAEDILWYVMDRDGGEVLLLSVDLLDAERYHLQSGSITWESCRLRQWMNDDFYDRAFTNAEKKLIQTRLLKNEDNSYGTEGGNDTVDKVFALSWEEVVQYLGISVDDKGYRISSTKFSEANATTHARVCGALFDRSWWLRSPGSDNGYAKVVGGDRVGEYRVEDLYIAVRPALWLDLNP